MRTLCILFLWCLTLQSVFAAESNVTITVDGITYSNVTFGAVTPATVKVFHSSGIAVLPLAKLSPELQQRFGYAPQKAGQYLQTEAQRRSSEQAAEKQKKLAVALIGKVTAVNSSGVVVQTQAASTEIQYDYQTHVGIAGEYRGTTQKPVGTKTVEAQYAVLVGHPRQSSFAVGDAVSCRAYRDGVANNDGKPLPRWVYIGEKELQKTTTKQPAQ